MTGKSLITLVVFSIILVVFLVIKGNSKPIHEFNNETIEILFRVKATTERELAIFEDGIIPWISIESPQDYLPRLMGKDEIVLSSKAAILIIDYPLNKPVEIEIGTPNELGFTREALVTVISKIYHKIYKEEEATAKTKTIPLAERGSFMNRNETDGKYGIWGHDIGDLDLAAIVAHWTIGKKPKLELYIES